MKAWIPGLAVAAVLTGCSYSLWVTVDGDLAGPRIRINAPNIVNSGPCILAVWVTTDANPADRLWEARTSDGACRDLPQVIYGQTPAGFVSPGPARPLSTGVLYRASASATGAGGAIQVIHADGAWRNVKPPAYSPAE